MQGLPTWEMTHEGCQPYPSQLAPPGLAPQRLRFPTGLINTVSQDRTGILAAPSQPISSLRLYHYRYLGELGKNATATPDRYPFVQENFKRAPHCNPPDDKQTFTKNAKNGSILDGMQQSSQQQTPEQEQHPGNKRDSAIVEQQTEAPPFVCFAIEEIVVNCFDEAGCTSIR